MNSRHLAGIGIAFLTAALTACGAPQGQAPRDGGDEPKYGGVMNLRMTRDMWQWDMSYEGQSPPNDRAIRTGYNSLLGFKSGPDIKYSEFTVQPELAERWEVSPDARTFTFYLRQGVKFANLSPVNGRELNARDVKFSYEYLSRSGEFKGAGLPPSQFEWMFEGLESVEARDSHTVQVRFKDGYAPFLNYAAHKLNPIMPREIYDQEGHLKDRIAGTGPFQLDFNATQRGTRWVLKKNEDYWDAGKPYVDEVRLLVLADDGAAAAAFQTRQVDYLSFDNPPEAEEIAKKTGAVSYEVTRTPRYVLTHTRRGPLTDVRVRKAISLSIDRDEFNRVLSAGRGAWGLAGSNAWADLFTQEEARQILPYDPAQAKRLLAEAGFPNGVDIEFSYSTDSGQDPITTFELLQAQLKKSGINLVAKPMPYSDLTTRRKKHEFQMDHYTEFPRPDPDAALYATFYPGARSNYNEVDDPRLTEMILAQRREPDVAKRRELIRQAVRYANEQAYGVAVVRPVYVFLWQPYVKGLYPQQDHGTSAELSAALAWLDK